jgi:hypothetical protein
MMTKGTAIRRCYIKTSCSVRNQEVSQGAEAGPQLYNIVDGFYRRTGPSVGDDPLGMLRIGILLALEWRWDLSASTLLAREASVS